MMLARTAQTRNARNALSIGKMHILSYKMLYDVKPMVYALNINTCTHTHSHMLDVQRHSRIFVRLSHVYASTRTHAHTLSQHICFDNTHSTIQGRMSIEFCFEHTASTNIMELICLFCRLELACCWHVVGIALCTERY